MSRPSVTWKTATSLDGRIALASGESRWITGPLARLRVHELRAGHDGVLTGIGTVLADDPELTVRDAPLRDGRQPLRVVMDAGDRLLPEHRIVRSAGLGPVLAYAAEALPTGDGPERRDGALEAAGVSVVRLAGRGGRPDPVAVLDDLARRGVGSVLLESGGRLAASFLSAGLIDRIEWFRAPVILGGDAEPALAALGLTALSDAPRFHCVATEKLGSDSHETYMRGQV